DERWYRDEDDEPVDLRALPCWVDQLRGRPAALHGRQRVGTPPPTVAECGSQASMIQFAKKVRGILVKSGKLDGEQADALIVEAQKSKSSFTDLIVKKDVLSEKELIALIGRAANVPPVDLARLNVNKDVLDTVPVDVAKDYHIFPIDRIGNILTVAVANAF